MTTFTSIICPSAKKSSYETSSLANVSFASPGLRKRKIEIPAANRNIIPTIHGKYLLVLIPYNLHDNLQAQRYLLLLVFQFDSQTHILHLLAEPLL